jgi:uncharacterized protein (TIGR03382 family)
MKRNWLYVIVIIAVTLSVWGGMPAQTARAAAATTTYDFVPAFIPDDATPVAVRVTFSTLTIGQCYVYKVRLYKTAGTYFGEMWNPTTSTWAPNGGAYSVQNQFTASATSQSFWVYIRNTTLAASTIANDASLAIIASSNGTTCVSGPTFVNGTPASVTIMKTTTGGTAAQFGGWLDEINGTSRAGRAIVVKSGSNIVGMYVAEDNNVNEGYVYAAGGYKVAVPSCAGCNYAIETWDLAAPNIPVGITNIMGAGGCSSDVSVGIVTSLSTCTSPTAVTLRDLTASTTTSPAPIIFGVLGLTAAALLLRRKTTRSARH